MLDLRMWLLNETTENLTSFTNIQYNEIKFCWIYFILYNYLHHVCIHSSSTLMDLLLSNIQLSRDLPFCRTCSSRHAESIFFYKRNLTKYYFPLKSARMSLCSYFTELGLKSQKRVKYQKLVNTCTSYHKSQRYTVRHNNTPRLLECVGSALALRGCALACHCATFLPFVWAGWKHRMHLSYHSSSVNRFVCLNVTLLPVDPKSLEQPSPSASKIMAIYCNARLFLLPPNAASSSSPSSLKPIKIKP